MATFKDEDDELALGDTCVWCGKKEAESVCSVCMKVVYCGRQCQRAHWPGHKAECARLVREAEAAQGGGATPSSSSQNASEEAQREKLQREKEEEFRRHLDRMNKEHMRQVRREAMEQKRRKLEEAFQRFMASLQRSMLPRLPPCGPGDTVPVVVCGPAEATRRRVEPAGLAFLELYERSMPSFAAAPEPRRRKPPPTPQTGPTNQQRDSSRSRKREATPSAKRSCLAETRSKLHLHKARLTSNLQGVELYTLLGLEMRQKSLPTLEEVKDAYRKKALVCHPDKKEGSTAAIILIQEAYEYLVDPENKQIYDSTLPFDDSIPPEDKISQKGFFKVLRPVFERNARWSIDQPVPELGDAETPVEEVHEFYRFWYDFASWRDVSPKFLTKNNAQLMDIYDCDRRERRERQRQNTSIRKKFEVQEGIRITKLVELAWKHDPRLEEVRRKGQKQQPEQPEEEQEQKEQISKEEQERREAEEKALREEERRKEKEAREAQRQAAKKRRARLRKVVGELQIEVGMDDLQRLCASIDPESLEALTAEVEGLGTPDGEDVSNVDGAGAKGSPETVGLSGADGEKPNASKRLAQEAIFEAMRKVGIEPTNPRLSPEEDEEAQAKEHDDRARQERLKKRRKEAKIERRLRRFDDDLEERIQKCMKDIEDLKKLKEEIESGNLSEESDRQTKDSRDSSQFSRQADSRRGRMDFRREAFDYRQQELQRQEQERFHRAEETARRSIEVERSLEDLFHRLGDPAERERAQRLNEFTRIGGTGEAAGEVARAAIQAAPELGKVLLGLEEHKLWDPEGYADDVLELLADCAVPFFELGVRPPENSPQLNSALRTKIKRARHVLRNMVIKQSLVRELEPEPFQAPRQRSSSKTRTVESSRGAGRCKQHDRSSSAGRKRSNSRRQR